MVNISEFLDRNNKPVSINHRELSENPETVRRMLQLTVEEFEERFPEVLKNWQRNHSGRPQHELLD